MNKLLIMFINIGRISIGGSSLGDPTAYQPAMPRVALGIAGIALTAVTFAVLVILPAQTIPGNREPRVLEASEPTPPVAEELVTLASITVVAARDRGARATVRVSSAIQ